MAAANTPQQIFDQWMASRFQIVHDNVANNAAVGYTVVGQPSQTYNCFAYAVGVTDRKILPSTNAQLDEHYAAVGFYPVNGPAQVNDVEVYYTAAQGGSPQHAHLFYSAQRARSKMGDDYVISHPRDLLQSPRPNSNQHEYGVVGRIYRRNQAQFALDQQQMVTTSSGRQVKKSETVLSQSGKKRVPKDVLNITRSGRVVKAPKKTSAATEKKVAAEKKGGVGNATKKDTTVKKGGVEAAHKQTPAEKKAAEEAAKKLAVEKKAAEEAAKRLAAEKKAAEAAKKTAKTTTDGTAGKKTGGDTSGKKQKSAVTTTTKTDSTKSDNKAVASGGTKSKTKSKR